MSQTWNSNTYQGDHVVSTDMVNIENNFATLKSMFSGGSAPANPVAGMPWFHTTNKILKIRNNANSAWLGLLYGTTSLKVWIYANVAQDGWVIDSGVTDSILALKGGAQAYNISGGGTGGTWTQPSHTLLASEIPAHTHGSAGSHTHSFPNLTFSYGSSGSEGSYGGEAVGGFGSYDIRTATTMSTAAAHTHTSVGGGGSHNHGTTYRPLAAVGTLQYPNV